MIPTQKETLTQDMVSAALVWLKAYEQSPPDETASAYARANLASAVRRYKEGV